MLSMAGKNCSLIKEQKVRLGHADADWMVCVAGRLTEHCLHSCVKALGEHLNLLLLADWLGRWRTAPSPPGCWKLPLANSEVPVLHSEPPVEERPFCTCRRQLGSDIEDTLSYFGPTTQCSQHGKHACNRVPPHMHQEAQNKSRNRSGTWRRCRRWIWSLEYRTQRVTPMQAARAGVTEVVVVLENDADPHAQHSLHTAHYSTCSDTGDQCGNHSVLHAREGGCKATGTMSTAWCKASFLAAFQAWSEILRTSSCRGIHRSSCHCCFW